MVCRFHFDPLPMSDSAELLRASVVHNAGSILAGTPRSLPLWDNGNARYRMDFHPLAVKRVLHVPANNAHVRTDGGQ